MIRQEIDNILKMRMAVYKAGVKAGCWNDIDLSGASDMMVYIFPKSGKIAYYNLILEQMRKEHSMFTGEAYSLFKMPVQIEKEIIEYLKKDSCDLTSIIDDCDAYLQQMDTIVTDYCFTPVNVGSFRLNELDSLLRLCASHYRYSFCNGIKSYPYFE